MTARKHISGIGLLLAALAVVIAMSAMLPTVAQDSTVDEGEIEILVGPVEFGPNGEILVNGVVVAPASGFNPSTLEAGEIVVVTGILLPSGTLQAASLEPFDDESPEVTPEPTAEVTPEPTAEITPEPTAEVTPEPTAEITPEPTAEVTPEATPESTPEAAACGPNIHPVLWEAAQAFGVSYDELAAMHCAGNGVGNIIRALALAQAMNDGTTALELLNRHKDGEGWGSIRKEGDVHPGDLAPGQLKKMEPTPEATAEDTNLVGGADENGNGSGNGSDKGKDKDKDEKDNNGRGNDDNPGNSGDRGNSGNDDNNGKGKGK